MDSPISTLPRDQDRSRSYPGSRSGAFELAANYHQPDMSHPGTSLSELQTLRGLVLATSEERNDRVQEPSWFTARS
jgi:hypothetical protein